MNNNIILLSLISLAAISGVYLATQTDGLQQESDKSSLNQLYTNWKLKYNKSYSNDSVLDSYRFSVFEENYNTVISHNKKQSSYKLGMNQFADLTDFEFQDLLLMRNQEERPVQTTQQIKNGDDVQKNPKQFFKGNVNYTSIMQPVQDQGACGSCYTFATAASLEAAYAIQTELPLQKFSEQQLVSCSQSYGNNGCGGGFGDASFSYVIDNGITTLKKYPYISGIDGVVPDCQVSSGEFKISSYTQIVGLGHCLSMQNALVDQPLYGRLIADNWKLYESGIFDDCDDDPERINHGITIVGFNTMSDDESENYWIIRNSWTPTWGEDGYMQLLFGNTCAICHDSYFPTV